VFGIKKKPTAQFFNHKKFLFSIAVGRFMNFPGYGVDTKCNNRAPIGAPEVISHDVKLV